MGEMREFNDWIREMTPDAFVDGAGIGPGWMAWIRAAYDDGARSRTELDARAQEAIDDLVAAAPWSRIAEDVRSTTGCSLELEPRLRGGIEDTWFEFDVSLDGRGIGSFGHSFGAPEPETVVAELADYLREFALDEEFWGGWPICPTHATHPLDAVLNDSGAAIWRCPKGSVSAAIGDLESIVP